MHKLYYIESFLCLQNEITGTCPSPSQRYLVPPRCKICSTHPIQFLFASIFSRGIIRARPRFENNNNNSNDGVINTHAPVEEQKKSTTIELSYLEIPSASIGGGGQFHFRVNFISPRAHIDARSPPRMRGLARTNMHVAGHIYI